MRRIFVAGGVVCNMDSSKDEIESEVNEALEESTSALVRFEYYKLSENKVRLVYIRALDYYSDTGEIPDCDMAMSTGVDIRNFYLKPLGDPVVYPLILKAKAKRFYTPYVAFIRFYKNLLIMLEQRVENIGVRCDEKCLVMEITY